MPQTNRAWYPNREISSPPATVLSACGRFVATLRMPRSLPAAAPSFGSTSVISAVSQAVYKPNPMPLTALMSVIPATVGMSSGITNPSATNTEAI